MKANASIMHTTPNGLGGDPAVNQPPSQLEQLMVRREVIINTIRFFEEDGDLVAADASRRALAELDEIIANLQAANSASICPVCGRAADHDWMTCAEADAQESRADREDRAAILDWIR